MARARRELRRAPWRRHPNLWSLAYFLVLTLAYFRPVLVGKSSSAVPAMQTRLWPWRGTAQGHEKLPLQMDGAVSNYPWSVATHEAMSRRTFPSWDWHSFSGGYDLVHNGVSGATYPPQLALRWLVEPALAHDVFMFVHMWLAGFVMYLLLRHWRVGTLPALFGGTAWAFTPFNTGWMQVEMITPLSVLTPLTFLVVSMALRTPSVARVIAAGAAIALALVAGNTVMFLVLVWVVGLYGLTATGLRLARTRDVRRGLREAGALLALAACAGIFSAYSSLPTLRSLLSLGRQTPTLDQVLPSATRWSSAWMSIWESPEIDGSATLDLLGWCGRVVLVLAFVGLLHRGALRWGALALALGFTLLPILSPLITIGWYVLPPLRAVAGFGRLTFLASFGLVVLSALGLGVLLRFVEARLAHRHRARLPIIRVAAVSAAVVGVLIELVPFARAINPRFVERDPDLFYPPTAAHAAVIEARAEGAWPALMLPLSGDSVTATAPWAGASFWGATALTAGIDSVGGYDSAVPERAAGITRAMQGVALTEATKPFGNSFLPNFSIAWTRLDLAAKLGVTHVYVPAGSDLAQSLYAGRVSSRLVSKSASGQVFELPENNRQPRIVGSAVYARDDAEALQRFFAADHDPARAVVLESGPGGRPAGSDESTPSPGRVLSSAQGSDSASVSYTSSAPAWLVVPIGFNSGWRATVDGQELPTRPGDYAFTAVRVPAGSHEVSFSFTAAGQRTGTLLSLLGALAALGVLVAARRSTRGVANSGDA